MNEDRDWNQLGSAWKAEPQPTPGAISSSQRVIKHSLHLTWRKVTVYIAIASILAFVASLCLLHRSIENYTLAVIAWSAFFSFGGFMVGMRDPAGDLALETTDALRARSNRLARNAQMLDFWRVLVGVETLIYLGFWVALRHGVWSHLWRTTLAIGLSGVLLYCGLSWLLRRTRRERNGLDSIGKAMQVHE